MVGLKTDTKTPWLYQINRPKNQKIKSVKYCSRSCCNGSNPVSFDFSPVRLSMCVFKALGSEQTQSQWLKRTGVKYCGRAGLGGGNDSNPCSYHRLFNNISRTETPLYKEQDRIMMIPTSLRSFALASIYRADDVLTR